MRPNINPKLIALAVLFALPTVTLANVLLEEIVVTATKRTQSIQDVGIAITAMSGEQMEALGFANAQQVTTFAPGVSTVQPNGEANYSIGIRGVTNSDFTTNVESPVALYVDEVYNSQMSGAGFALFDMERVEILRGPQGTLFGRNATGGLAHFITRKPSQESDGYIKATVGDYGQLKLEGAIGGALSDNLSTRLSIATHDNDGYITNRLGRDLNNANDFSGRLQFLYTPSDDFEALINIRRATQDIRTGFFENVSSVETGQLTPNTFNPVLEYIDNDGDVFAGDYDDPGFNDLETQGYSATFKWAINDSINLTSVSDYSTTERVYIEDSDASPAPVFNFFLTTDAKQLSQEIRLDGGAGKLKWVVGGYYLDLDINDSNGAITDPFIGGGGTSAPSSEGGLLNPYFSDLQSTSVFGQIDYALSDTLELIAGLRFIKDDKDFAFSFDAVEYLNPASSPGFDNPSNVVLQGVIDSYQGSRSDSEVAGRLQLNWKYSDAGLAYFSVNRGVKGGGFNAPIFGAASFDDATFSYNPEALNAYEVGIKADIGEIGRINAAAYFYDYENYQLFTISGLDTITVNSPDAEASGFEVELQLAPTESWDFLFGVAYNDAEAEIPGAGGIRRRPIQSPEWNVNGLIRYSIPAFNGDLAFQLDADYRDDITFALSGTPNVAQDAYTVANVSTTYTNDKWKLSAFIQNLGDEEYQVQAFDLSGLDVFGITEQYYGRPRWWGVSARYSW
ncbi:MAG: iron complex outermembrane receptor protein [Neolewinella sp.]|jgi:iron complex outermembrane receptor protein